MNRMTLVIQNISFLKQLTITVADKARRLYHLGMWGKPEIIGWRLIQFGFRRLS